jgi:hypothetical protein
MAIEFYDLPQGTPSVAPVSTGAAYCSASDVASLNKPRSVAWNTANNVTTTDVNGFIMMIAGQIDAVLVNKGYTVPVNTASNPDVEGLLAGLNAQGAAWLVERASPQVNPQQVTEAKLAYDTAMAALEMAKFTPNIPVDVARAQVRAPYVTYTPGGEYFDPQQAITVGMTGDGMGVPDSLGYGISGQGAAVSTGNPANPFFVRGMQF